MLHLNPFQWANHWALPARKDPRWIVCALLFTYLLLGVTVLGFSRKPEQILMVMALAAALDVLFTGVFRGEWVFPLSGVITSLSLCILLNFSYSFDYLWIPIFVGLSSKYLITLRGKHFFNPALFAIVFSILFLKDVISLAPAYQWYGSAGSAWVMGWFVLTAALLLFIFKIDRAALSLSFLFFFAIATLIRAYIMRHIVPVETLFIGAMTSPAFYLFTFYMITDPKTSPPNRREQVIIGFFIAALDLLYHKKLSYYTFFFAGMTVASVRFGWKHWQQFRQEPLAVYATALGVFARRALVLGSLAVLPLGLLWWRHLGGNHATVGFHLTRIPEAQSGLSWAKSNVLEEVDPRVAHVAKWVISVGDAVACADVNNDGLQDVFLTQTLKSKDWQAKLYLNKGGFAFEKVVIPDLERYLGNPKQYGLPGFGLFFDFDNDGDQDLFTGFAFGKSHLFENHLVPDGQMAFTEKHIAWLAEHPTVCLSANVLDYNRDGYLDLMVANTLPPYLNDYLPEKVPFNLFDLPAARYDGDRRMLHFMHESWQNANNGGPNYVLTNLKGKDLVEDTAITRCLPETRWSLAIGTSDLNSDDWPDVYIANDFGRDDCYLNFGGKRWERQQGRFYGELGLDTYKSMNTTVADFDGNGLEDVYESNVYHEMQAEGSLLWLNHTAKNASKVDFREKAAQYNILNINRFGWGAAACDLNLDGHPDLVQANGMTGDEWDKRFPYRDDFWYYQAQVARTPPNVHSYADKWADIRGRCIYENEADCVFLNHDGKGFTDVADAVGLSHRNNTRGVAAVDLDNDGDQDLIITDQYGAPKLYRNDQQKAKNWLGIDLKGNGSTCALDAVGTKVWLAYKVDNQPKTQFQELHAANGFSAQGDHRLLFGLGEAGAAEIKGAALKVRWADGKEEQIDVPALGKYMAVQRMEK